MSRNTRWQFSLRALLIVTTIASAVLAVAVRQPHLLWIAFLATSAASAVTATLLIGDTFVRLATKRHWATVTRVAWMMVAALFAAMALIAVLVAYG